MNLLIKIIYLFVVIVASKNLIPRFVQGTFKQNATMVAILFLANFFYRVSVNFYFQKKDSITNIALEGFYRTLLVIVGIVIVNYLISNPQVLGKYGIDVPKTNVYSNTLFSLMPFLFTKALLAPDI